ncbi:uncharacterized protein K444DRAFT_537731 [Hyaloscypha bicolor E]|uniref:Nudix hydrolase domain-containing protein n=1 Tax=Hyaloscypha bicolor E TaxID=1095630 RepID=A0A2J6SXH7_9HELO|nr:uncharacterized protein K444DRAFT_537731 [Hyaloscypha bicolor E]PMD55488.1 hypothetical protein K444DRAFT_537731 [Hyaloscypha bicolor E]
MALSPSFSFTYDKSLRPFDITPKVFLSQRPKFDNVAAGTLNFNKKDELLLIKRASNDTSPNRWEIPGGVGEEGETILHCAARETFEETGLIVVHFKRLVGGEVVTDGSTCKLSFEVEVKSTEGVTLNPEEHQDYLWVTKEMVGSLEITGPEHKATILEAFQRERKEE